MRLVPISGEETVDSLTTKNTTEFPSQDLLPAGDKITPYAPCHREPEAELVCEMTDGDERHPKLVPIHASLLLIVTVCVTLVNSHIIKNLSTAQEELPVTVNFPSHVTDGDNVTLTCNYDLKGKPLYTVRWYFNLQEVYRYTENPRRIKKVSPVSDVYVDVSSMTQSR